MTAGVRFGDVRTGDRLAPVTMPITYTRVCQNAAATLDWMPGHHDPAYARAQGQETIYLSRCSSPASSIAASPTGRAPRLSSVGGASR